MESIIPPDVPSKHQYIRKKLYEFAKGNHTVTHRIWKNHCPTPSVTDPNEEKEAYDKWIETLRHDKMWGDPAEYILFSYCFEIHVVCVRQLVNRVEAYSTHDFYKNCKVRSWKSHNTNFGEIPSAVKNVIFIWHHILDDPERQLDYPNDVKGNHYSLLELKSVYSCKYPTGTFFLQHHRAGYSTEVTSLDSPTRTPNKSPDSKDKQHLPTVNADSRKMDLSGITNLGLSETTTPSRRKKGGETKEEDNASEYIKNNTMKQKSSKKRKIFPDKDRRQSKKKSPPVDESVLIPETGHEDVQGDVPFATEAAGCKQNDVSQPENSTKIIPDSVLDSVYT
jgi:hypothetical protein